MFDLKLIGKRGRRCTHLGTQQGRGNDAWVISSAAVDEILSDGLGHLNTKGQLSHNRELLQNTIRIINFTVAHHVNNSLS